MTRNDGQRLLHVYHINEDPKSSISLLPRNTDHVLGFGHASLPVRFTRRLLSNDMPHPLFFPVFFLLLLLQCLLFPPSTPPFQHSPKYRTKCQLNKRHKCPRPPKSNPVNQWVDCSNSSYPKPTSKPIFCRDRRSRTLNVAINNQRIQ